MHRRIVFALAALAAATSAAQEKARPDPTSPQAKVPPTEYRSAFEGYRPYADEKVRPWRQSNEAVKDEGSHAGHGAKPPAEKPAPKPEAGGAHGGHK